MTQSPAGKSSAERVRRISNDCCRTCGRAHETLGHILNACTLNAGLMRTRHNMVLHRLVRAIWPENKHIFVEQAISPDAVRPDLVVVDETKDTVVIDVTIPYEADRDAFEKARAEKIQKYSAIHLCGRAQETLGHILNACTPNAGLMRA